MNLSSISMHSLSEALAWTIFHSIWQAALIAGLLALTFRFINKNNARIRYTMASLSLLLIFVSASFTFFLSLPAETRPHILNLSGLSSNVIINTTNSGFSWASLKSLLPTHILFPILLRIWIIGIFLLSFRMVINYTTALRLKKHKAFTLNEKHMALAYHVLERFDIRKKVLFRESSYIDSPSLIGYFKPVILLPINLLSGIPKNQLEIIIAHELAHISRHDYLVQFIQGIIEILFFYHPMVWWLSSVVNTEREHICDDLAVKVCGESLTLIKALNNMESIRRKKPELVLSFSGKKANLLHRVRRILNPVTVKHPKLERGLLSALFVFALSGMILFSNLANSKNQVQVESKNSTNLSIGEFDGVEMSHASPIIHAPQKKKKLTKNTMVAPAKPAIVSASELPALPELPEVTEKAVTVSDTIKEVKEVIEIQKEALEEALNELEEVNVQINEETIKELKESLKELESVDINIEKELIKAEAEMEIELKDLEEINEHDSLIEIDDNTDLSEKEKKELKAKIKTSLEKVNSEEFRQQIRENLERGRESLMRQMEKINSGEFQKNIEIQKEKIKKSKKKNIKTKIKFDSNKTPLCLLNGFEISKKVIEKLDPASIDSVTVLKDEACKKTYGAKAKDGVILIRTKNTVSIDSPKNKAFKFKGKTKTPLYIINGVELSCVQSIDDIDPNEIESMNLLKDASAIDKYGKKAKHGVIEITTKTHRKAPSFNEYMKNK
ncbi:hypothetical protein DWB61_05635 [Ancylomarina euxinus]|uniref:Peptidase M56 domain-containing protein n=1 Tax=Ancylomarina euxinus TaxID=2283627 RepID=A0A425Y455_9BACT|nr:M56 family metallopeptidase [Ancylomarina euxinus]MCZ4694517.1 M48 family metalloprotease [Ancylomarina euxinus]MUP14060.1 TonB-dependent receptor plug domain-containing protein [Ancylomarina euxinus]RRG22921.1 hypothetical protein DWB61_05635 [Ancylomarina euxinus]